MLVGYSEQVDLDALRTHSLSTPIPQADASHHKAPQASKTCAVSERFCNR